MPGPDMVDPPIHIRVLSVVSAARRGYRPLCRCTALAGPFPIFQRAFSAGLKPARSHLVLRVRRKDHLKREVVDIHAFQARKALQGLCELTGKPSPVSGNREFCGWECRPQQDDWRFTQVTKGRRRCSGRACPQRASSCRDNLQQPVAPRSQGSWVPSNSHTGVFGAPSLGALPTLVRENLFSWQYGGVLFGLPARGPSRPHRRVADSRVAALLLVPPWPGGRRPLTQSPGR